MKIGHYMRGIWEKGGVASYIRRISAAQEAEGHEIVYFDSLAPESSQPVHDRPVRFVRNDAELTSLAASMCLDILHVHTAIAAGTRTSVPTIRTVHGHQPYCPSGSRFLKRTDMPCDRSYGLAGCVWGKLIDRCGSARPGRMIEDFRLTSDELSTLRKIPSLTVSKFLKEQMVRSGHPESSISVLYLPAPVRPDDAPAKQPSPKIGVPHFVFAGRLTPQKGVAWLLKAASQVETDIHVDIAGEGYQADELKALSRRLGIADRVTFHGWVDGDKIDALLTQARALVFPSVWHEPGGTVAFEAMVNARAVVMSRVGGMPEIVGDGDTGILVNPGDVNGLARAITHLAVDWHEARLLGDQGYAKVQQKFGFDDHMNQLMGHYDRCCRQFDESPAESETAASLAVAEGARA